MQKGRHNKEFRGEQEPVSSGRCAPDAQQAVHVAQLRQGHQFLRQPDITQGTIGGARQIDALQQQRQGGAVGMAYTLKGHRELIPAGDQLAQRTPDLGHGGKVQVSVDHPVMLVTGLAYAHGAHPGGVLGAIGG